MALPPRRPRGGGQASFPIGEAGSTRAAVLLLLPAVLVLLLPLLLLWILASDAAVAAAVAATVAATVGVTDDAFERAPQPTSGPWEDGTLQRGGKWT